MPQVSIICPAYNAERFISCAIRSIQRQTWSDWELLVVDNNSTDGTAKIIKRMAAKDSRIKYLFQPVSGASSARNMGLDHAKGEYILFLDADDYYCRKKIIQECIEAFRKYPDISLVSMAVKTANRYFLHIPMNDYFADKKVFRDAQISGCNTFYFNNKFYILCAWGVCFKKEIIDRARLRFLPDVIFGEDSLFLLFYSLNCEPAGYFISDESYCYVRHSQSICHRNNREEKRDQFLNVIRLVEDAVDFRNLQDISKYRLLISWCSAITIALDLDSAESAFAVYERCNNILHGGRYLAASFIRAYAKYVILYKIKSRVLRRRKKIIEICYSVFDDASAASICAGVKSIADHAKRKNYYRIVIYHDDSLSPEREHELNMLASSNIEITPVFVYDRFCQSLLEPFQFIFKNVYKIPANMIFEADVIDVISEANKNKDAP